jgi:hypothetical protein
MSDAGLALFIAGSTFDALGVFLVLAPDLVPYRKRLSVWLRRSYRRFVDWVRRGVDRLLRALGRRRAHVVTAGAAIEASAALSAKAFVSPPEGASLEEKVEYLLGRERLAQDRFGSIEGRLADLESRRLDELRNLLEAHVSEAITEAERRYRPLRVLGGFSLVAGLVCLSVANFI